MFLIILVISIGCILLNTTVGSIMWAEDCLDYYKPVYFYNHSEFNIIGVTVITILLYTFTLPVAVCYWIYQLFTVGK